MTRLERYNFLCVFGDNKPHDWYNVIFLSVHSMKKHQKTIEGYLKKFLEDGLIKRVDSPEVVNDRRKDKYIISSDMFLYQLTKRGDELLRNEQMARGGDNWYYKGFSRKPENKYADNVSMPKKRNDL